MTFPDASPFPDTAERQATRRRKRDAVLIAAVRMFNARGFHATSLDDVAASLGISKPTIDHYLGSKDRVLLECVTIGLNQLRDAAEAAKARPGTGLDRLRSFLESYARVNMEDFGRCVIRTGDEMLSPQSATTFRGLKRDIDNRLRELIRDAVADGSIRPVDERIAAFAFAGALNWPARWYNEEGPESPEDTARALTDILIQGCAPR
jgi:AcrR family transcriptional regulator